MAVDAKVVAVLKFPNNGRCRHCGSDTYRIIGIKTLALMVGEAQEIEDSGALSVTGITFCCCDGCSAVFLNPRDYALFS